MKKDDINIPEGSINMFYVLQRDHKLCDKSRAELEKDMAHLIISGKEKWSSAGSPKGYTLLYCNERLGSRYFRVRIAIDYSTEMLNIDEFSELTLDEYLDSMNFAKDDLPNMGFKPI